jgi:uncharacterized protein YcbX
MPKPEGSPARVSALYRYPVKGLTPERLDSVALVPGETLPFDRAYAIENGPGKFNPEAPRHVSKGNFLMLRSNERLATLRSAFDDATRTLAISRAGKQVVRGELDTALGRRLIEQFFAAYMKADLRGAPKIVHAPGHSISDVDAKCLHIVNLATVRELERVIGRKVDPLRFRANVYVDGVAPWAELQWLDKEIAIGPARLAVFARTQRCAATEVDPETGARDMAIPATLMRTWGHANLGIYAKVVTGGTIGVGSEVADR